MRLSAFHKLGLAVAAVVVAATTTVSPAAETATNDATPAAAASTFEVTSTLPKSPATIAKLPAPEEAPLSVGGISIPEPASVALVIVGSAAILVGRRPREVKKA